MSKALDLINSKMWADDGLPLRMDDVATAAGEDATTIATLTAERNKANTEVMRHAGEVMAVNLQLDKVRGELAQLRAELAEARAVVEKQGDALTHIAEYWNRSENDKAMNDALYHMIDTAEAALASKEASKPGGNT